MAATEEKVNPNLAVWNAVARTPDEAKKRIDAGRLKGKTDISPIFRIKMLTSVYGPCGIGWYVDNVQYTKESPDGTPEVALICTLNLHVKDPETGKWSEPIFGVGGSKLFARETNGLYLNDEAYKMAETDAISVACKMLGVAADVYWSGEERTKYMFDAEAATGKHKVAPPTDNKPNKFLVDQWTKELAAECETAGLALGPVIEYLRNKNLISMSGAYDMTTGEWEQLKGAVIDYIGGRKS